MTIAPTNNQNTQIAGAGNLIPLTGNPVLDKIFGAANVAVTGAANLYGVYDTYAERLAQREIAKANATKTPEQSLPANQANSPADYLSVPDRAKTAFVYAGLGALLIAGGFFLYKKAR